MSGSPYGGSDGFETFVGWIHRSLRIGRLFGIEVRVYWTALLVTAVFVAVVGSLPGVTALGAVAYGVLHAVGLYVIVLTHELGHAFAGRGFGVRTPTITLSALGGLAHMSDAPPGPKADVVIALAGPLTHALWIGLAWVLRDVVPPVRLGAFGIPVDTMAVLLETNLWLAAFNLLPCFPMDGGRVLRGLIALRRAPNLASLWAARVGALGAVAFFVWGMQVRGTQGTILVFIGVNNLLACLREMTAARYGESPYGAPSDPWAFDPDAWKRGESPAGAGERRGLLARLGLRRGAPARRPAADERGPQPLARRGDDEELDRLLAKVGRVGLPGLTADERETLRRISEARRARR